MHDSVYPERSLSMPFAKAQLIEAVYGIVTPANVKLFLVFDALGNAQTITDRSTIGGTTAHVTTLRDDSLNAINASTCTPGVSGLASCITLDTTYLWNTPDVADLSFGNGSADSAFSIVALANPTNATSSTLATKGNFTTGSRAIEWRFRLNASDKLEVSYFDNSESTLAYIGRSYGTVLTTDQGTFHTYSATKSTGVTCAAINLYRDGVVVDNTDYTAGAYTAMEDTTALVGSYQISTAGAIETPFKGKMSVLLVVAEELTAIQEARMDAVLRRYAGVAI
jgi:hypothetical protein